MQVVYQNTSDPVTLDVLNTAPGVYTQSADGQGAVTAVNPDGSTNAPLNPVTKGRIVSIYASGLGAVTPSVGTGQMPPTSPLSLTNFLVTAVVDGMQAEVTWAGLAPGYPGVYQVNVRIPTGATSGARPLTLFAGGVPCQSGVNIFIQ
jgi:adhesin/invasin